MTSESTDQRDNGASSASSGRRSKRGQGTLIKLIDLNLIHPNSFNPNIMPSKTFMQLVDDMRRRGADAVNPIMIRSVEGDPPYEIVDGESRWKAAKELRWKTIRCDVRPMSLDEAKAECYRKSKERGTIDPFKEAELFKSEMDGGLTTRKIARKYGVSLGYVGESLRLLTNLDPSIRRRASSLFTRVNKQDTLPLITRTHLEQLASIEDKVQQRHLFETMVGAARAGRLVPTTRQLEIERKKLEHSSEPSEVPPEELFLDNVWPPESERDDVFGNSDFPGNCSGTVCKQCLWRYTKPGETVLDPMAGSGTMIDVAKKLGRKCIAFDINPVPYRDDIRRGDARKLPLKDESVDFVFLHFPYWRMHRYSDPPLSGDLSVMEYRDFLESCDGALREAVRLLRPGRFVVVLIGDSRKDLQFYDLPAELSMLGRRVGLGLFDKVIKPTVRERSSNANSEILARKYNFHLIKFETLLIFRKR